MSKPATPGTYKTIRDKELERLRDHGDPQDFVRFLSNNRRLAGRLPPHDAVAFGEDVEEIVYIALDRGLSCGRREAEHEFLTHSLAPGWRQ